MPNEKSQVNTRGTVNIRPNLSETKSANTKL